MAKAFPNTGATVIDSVADLPAASADLEGVMVFQRDSNELKICDGSSWVSMLDTDTPPGMTLVGSNTFTSSTSISLDNVFTSAYTNYRMVIYVSAASATGALQLFVRLRTSGSDSSAGYDHVRSYMSSGAAYGNINYSNQNAFMVNTTGGGDNTMTYAWGGFVIAPATTKQTAFTGDWVTTEPTQTYAGQWACSHRTAGAYDGITLFPSSGNITGSIQIYGLKG